MAVSERFLDELVARSEISDIVSDYVALNRKGDRFWGLCPFHGEKTPSFSVSPDRQVYYCFGCHKGGGVISFVMEMENLPFLEAVRHLAKRANLEMPEQEEHSGFRRKRERLYALNKAAARHFHAQLSNPAGQAGREYLAQRRLSQSTVTRFGLGMAPEGWDNLIAAMAAQGFEKSELLDAGLAVRGKEGRVYDRFRDRVMFPIIDLRGEVIGFGGRVLGDGTPKYLNSPETSVFNKGRNLFALNLARKTKGGRIILTEGYMDTIALHQAGFDGAVASLGTALTPEHAQLLARYTKEVVIAYDGDGAGVTAAQRAIPLLERTGMAVKVLRMRGAKDPDEFIGRYGRDAFARLLDKSENHIEYRLGQIEGKYDLTDDAQKVDYTREASDLLASLPSPVEREVYGGRCAESAGISPQTMAQEVAHAAERRARAAKKKQERRDLTPAMQLQPAVRELRYEQVRSARAEEGILRLIFLDPSLLARVTDLTAEEFSVPFLGKSFALLRSRWEEGRPVTLAALAGELTGDESALLARLLQKPERIDQGGSTIQDYRSIMATERAAQAARKAAEHAEDALMAAREKYREKKSFGGESP